MSEFDGELSTHINNQFSNYTCKDSQNEMISLVACHIKNKTLPKAGEYYSLIADETMDLSKIEQVCVCLRYVEHDLNIHAPVATADWIFNLLKKVLESLKLDINLMVGQSYDGAATIIGIKNEWNQKSS